jgi:hypothetical protein
VGNSSKQSRHLRPGRGHDVGSPRERHALYRWVRARWPWKFPPTQSQKCQARFINRRQSLHLRDRKIAATKREIAIAENASDMLWLLSNVFREASRLHPTSYAVHSCVGTTGQSHLKSSAIIGALERQSFYSYNLHICILPNHLII